MAELQHAGSLGIRIVATLAIVSLTGLVAPLVRAQSSAPTIGAGADDDGAYLGVRLTEETEHEGGGARVTHVVDDSPAADGGILEQDIIVEFGGTVIHGPAALTRQISAREAGDGIRLEVIRDGRPIELEVELGRRATDLEFVPRWSRRGKAWQEWQEALHERAEDLGRRLGRNYAITLPEGGSGFRFDVNCGRPRLGVQLVETTPELREHLGGDENEGVLVSKVLQGTPAARAAIAVGDLILSIDGESVASVDELREALQDKSGKTFPVRVIREGKPVTCRVTISEPESDRPTGPRA